VIKQFFPPKGTIHVEKIDDYPICAVVKRNHLDSRGIDSVRHNKFESGMKLLDSAYKYDPNNFGIWFWMGYGYFHQQKYTQCMEFMKKAINFWPDNNMLVQGRMYTGASLVNSGKPEEGIRELQSVASYVQDEFGKCFVSAHLGIACYSTGKYKESVPYLQQGIRIYPQLMPMLIDASRR
jgi:tetratricopeptide (TPR) repeat protein